MPINKPLMLSFRVSENEFIDIDAAEVVQSILNNVNGRRHFLEIFCKEVMAVTERAERVSKELGTAEDGNAVLQQIQHWCDTLTGDWCDYIDITQAINGCPCESCKKRRTETSEKDLSTN